MDCLRDPTTLVRLELVEVAHLAEEKVLCAWEMPLHEIIKVFHESHAMFRIFVSPPCWFSCGARCSDDCAAPFSQEQKTANHEFPPSLSRTHEMRCR